MIRVCFVCLGNICRSPTAEGVLRHLASHRSMQIDVESAGTSGHHVGERPDARSRAAAASRGILVEGASAQFQRDDFGRFDYVIALDRQNRADLLKLDPSADVYLLRDFDPESPKDADVPDPYYGGIHGFDEVLDLCESACDGFLNRLEDEAGRPTPKQRA